MKLNITTTPAILCAFIFFFSCDGDSPQQNKSNHSLLINSSQDENIYYDTMIFLSSNLTIPVEVISKYKSVDTTGIITNPTAHFRHGYKTLFNELSTKSGQKYTVHLPTKTSVSLNSGSTLIFHPSNSDYFELNGEGIFDIGVDSTQIIVNNTLTLVARKGTTINITAYQDSGKKTQTRITLVKGKASLRETKFRGSLNLDKAGSQAVIDYSNNTITTGKCQLEDVLAWIRDEFRYEDIDYRILLQRICRWYGLDLEYPEDLSSSNWAFGASFKEPAEKVIERLNSMATNETTCRIEGKKLIVSRKQIARGSDNRATKG